MGKGVLKYGGKSGILPKVRPVFKRFPIAPKNPDQIAKESKVSQGYAEGVPLPIKKGFTFHREPVEKKVVTVEERIKRNIEDRRPNVDESSLSQEQLWQLKRDEIRRDYLKQAYLTEAERLKKLEEYKAKAAEREQAFADSHVYEESAASKLTLPTIDSYLQGPIMRQRTEEEQLLVEEQRTLNRKTTELQIKEEKANKLLDLYHAASNFITTEEELEAAINEAFEVNFSKFDGSQSIVESRLVSSGTGYANIDFNERIIADEVLGEISGKPGLQVIKDTLSGEGEKLKREAQVAVNQE
ncbi:uncharacterized protein CANTADRAFT_51542 [Suhomyces tanzawaensis NRRL Y-17324]|uniref:Uncharacterized protein n=1 Tax=Suhomyces tanzawaensis NRRL Y-17324 TaxID=984487 RepID=A0A1E4SHB7_9ASCO|nr:uncharacterized protein CANTADRAFT_51542 [Suhomyces tanzawaensis NRRL Y-17324]ODV78909.1 hypothetical protein CANTADRAFT_51542 [Suhomyces tanzawaensis NRRL Y-17324]